MAVLVFSDQVHAHVAVFTYTGNDVHRYGNTRRYLFAENILRAREGVLKEYKPLEKRRRHFHLRSIRYNLHYLDAPFKTLVILGIKDRARLYYWKLVAWSLFRRPLLLPTTIMYMVYGFHFRKVFGKHFEGTK
jgi:hypothetical protein